MWHAIWHMGTSLGEKLLRSTLIYAFLMVALRVLGKRELGQANTLDLLVLLLVANAVQNGIIGNDTSVTGAIVGAATLFAINRAASWLVARYRWAHWLFEGNPTPLIRDHQLLERNLRRQEISESDLAAMARRQGFGHLGDVREATLETSGTISMLR